MRYITLAIHNSELFIIKDMDAFATLFCYSKKMRHDQVGLIPSPHENPDDAEIPILQPDIEDAENVDEDHL